MKIRLLIKGFKNAIHGLVYVFKNEQNFRIQIFVAFIVVMGMIIFPIGDYERIALILLILLILILELINSAIELFVDVTKPRLHHKVKLIKDIMAATVFVASTGAFIVGLLIFLPHIFKIIW
ncbi:MAG: diacylglycerol kinase [Candidatus Magasanikbacteria bacterium]|nr:diacylglycerol kinase [Candidatus Magasanikbacteria bacterium]